MRRAILFFLALAVVLPASMALRAQDADGGKALDDLIRDAKKRLAAKLASAQQKPIRFEQHMYDIRDLTTPVQDHPGRSLNLVPSGGFGFAFSDQQGEESLPFYDGDMLVETIRGYIAPGSWDELNSVSIDYQNGYLIVRHTAAVQKLVQDFLAEVRSRSAASLTVRARWIRVSGPDLRSLLGDGSAAVLGDDAEAKLAALVKDGKAKVLRRGAVQCVNTQRVNLTALTRTSYLQDYDVEIAEGAAIADPIMQELEEGVVVDVRPVLAGEGDIVILEVRADVAHAADPIAKLDTPLGAIQTPLVDLMRIRTTLATPLGRSVAVAGTVSGDSSALLVLTPTATRPGR